VISIEIFEKLKTHENLAENENLPENLAYVSIHNFDRMHCVEKFYAYPKERIQNSKS